MEFNAFPTEIKLLICSFLERRSISAILQIQAVSKEFRDVVWRSRTHFALHEWENFTNPLNILNRGDPNIITFLDASSLDQVSQKLPTALDFIAKYSALESLHLDELPADTDLILLENAISSHKSLIEIQTSINPSLPIESFRNIARKVRLVINQPDASNALDMPTFNFNTSTIFRQKDDVTFPTSNKIVKGISIFGKLIVGASDGTIYVYELNGDQYHIRQTLHEHQAEITCICHQPHYREDLVISSVDGKVTRWRVPRQNGDMTLKDTKQFPESIYFLYYSDRMLDVPLLIAASKNTVYFYVDKVLKKQCKLDNVITGLHYQSVRHDMYVSTEVDLHLVPGLTLRQSKDFELTLTPEGGFANLNVSEKMKVASITPTELWIKPFLFPSAKFSLKGTFNATDPNLVAFTPDGNTVTCSNGHCLLTYDLGSKSLIACVSPRISKENLLNGNFPTCKALWYSYEWLLYALYSDNKVYWWSIESKKK